MAESPLNKLARLVGGVTLLQGRFGAQVLGNLLITNTTALELAGANVAVAAAGRRRSVFTQAAVGTVAPALALHGIARREEKRLDGIAKTKALAFERERTLLLSSWEELEQLSTASAARIQQLEQENAALRAELEAQAQQFAAQPTPAKAPPSEPPPSSKPSVTGRGRHKRGKRK